MANPKWGVKRICSSCGTKFYDLRRTPITCPKCETLFVPEPPPKPRRSTAPAAVVKPPEAKVAAEAGSVEAEVIVAAEVTDEDKVIGEVKVTDLDDGDEKDIKNDKADKDAGIIEDPSELGEDEDDMAEVIDGIKEKED